MFFLLALLVSTSSKVVHQTSIHSLVSEIIATVLFSLPCVVLALLKMFSKWPRKESSQMCKRNQVFYLFVCLFCLFWYFSLIQTWYYHFFSSTHLKTLQSLTLKCLISAWTDCLRPAPAPYILPYTLFTTHLFDM